MLRRFAFWAVMIAGVVSAALAEPVDNAPFGFVANFPCESATATQIVNTPSGGVTMSLFVCSTDAGSFFVSVSETPKGLVTDANRDAVLAGTITGIAANLKGKVREETPVLLDKMTGHDVLIDVVEEKAVAHARVFLANDRVYQVMAFVAEGKQADPTVVAFLDSFKLKPASLP